MKLEADPILWLFWPSFQFVSLLNLDLENLGISKQNVQSERNAESIQLGFRIVGQHHNFQLW